MTYPKLNEAQSAYLDFLRGMAALAVLFGHAAGVFLMDSALRWSNIETIGVFVFFLMSGFLISYSVFRKHRDETYGFREYFIDRFCRIYCAFFPALLFVWLLDSYSVDLFLKNTPEQISAFPTNIKPLLEQFTWQSGIGDFFMLQGNPIFKAMEMAGYPRAQLVSTFGSAGPFWTISIEWWIYITFGLFAYYVFKGKRMSLFLWAFFAFAAMQPFYFMIGGMDQCLTIFWVIGMIGSFVFLNAPTWLSASQWNIGTKSMRKITAISLVLALVLMLGRLVMIKHDTGKFNFVELQFGVFLAYAVFSGLLLCGTLPPPPPHRQPNRHLYCRLQLLTLPDALYDHNLPLAKISRAHQ